MQLLALAVVDRDTDRGGEHDLLAGNLDWRTERTADALGQRGQFLWQLLGDEQDRELIAAHAGQRIRRPQMALQPAGKGQ